MGDVITLKEGEQIETEWGFWKVVDVNESTGLCTVLNESNQEVHMMISEVLEKKFSKRNLPKKQIRTLDKPFGILVYDGVANEYSVVLFNSKSIATLKMKSFLHELEESDDESLWDSFYESGDYESIYEISEFDVIQPEDDNSLGYILVAFNEETVYLPIINHFDPIVEKEDE